MIFKFCLSDKNATKKFRWIMSRYTNGYKHMGACISRCPPFTYNRGIFIYPANILKHIKEKNTTIEQSICDVIIHESLHKAFDIICKDLNQENDIREFHEIAFGQIELYNIIEELGNKYPVQ